jgi:hypothetical protein
MSTELKNEVPLLFQRQEEAKTISLETNRSVLGRVVGTQMQKGIEVYSLLAREKEADLVALETRATLPLGALVNAEATELQNSALGWSFQRSQPDGRWQLIEHFEQVERTQNGVSWAADISSRLLPPLEGELLKVSTERDRLVESIRRSFPGLPIEPLSEGEAEKLARTHWHLDEIQNVKTELESVGDSLTRAKKEFLQVKEVRSELPRFSVLARWTATQDVVKVSGEVRSLQKRQVELQETLHRLEHHHGRQVTDEQVRRTVSGCHQVHERLYGRFRDLQRQSMQCSQELDYGRILVRTLKTLGDRDVTLTQTVGVGSKPAPLPVLRDAEAFRLMKTPCVRIK